MQDTDKELESSQQKRKKRIANMRKGILFFVAGWIFLSIILILFLLVKIISIDKKIDSWTANGGTPAMGDVLVVHGAVQNLEDTEDAVPTEQEADDGDAWEKVTPPATGIDQAENRAEKNDVHKVYLTFEDGPSENTAAILDILQEYQVKATFFVTGKEGEEAEPLYRRIVEEGHTLGMHSYSNKYSVIYQSQEAFEEDVYKLQDYLEQVTGVKSSYYRFPGGSSNPISNVSMETLIHFLNKEGITYYDWNVSAGDETTSAYTMQEIVENVTGDVVKYKTSVVLLHDGADKETTVEAIGALIEELQAMGAEILPIDQDTQVIQSVKAASVE